MVFEIQGKVALVTGGAGGLGLAFAKELLKNGLKGITIADVNEELGTKIVQELEVEFGSKRAIFVKTDVTDKNSFEDAFKETISVYNNLDILLNNAGISDEISWEKVVAVNTVGVITGTLLGLEKYIPQHKTGSEGVIVNTASVAGISNDVPKVPVYTSTKFSVVGLTMAFGVDAHYKRTGVRVITICPGFTDTPIINMGRSRILEQHCDISKEGCGELPWQEPSSVATGVVKIIQTAGSGTLWVVEGGKEVYQYILPPRESFATKA